MFFISSTLCSNYCQPQGIQTKETLSNSQKFLAVFDLMLIAAISVCAALILANNGHMIYLPGLNALTGNHALIMFAAAGSSLVTGLITLSVHLVYRSQRLLKLASAKTQSKEKDSGLEEEALNNKSKAEQEIQALRSELFEKDAVNKDLTDQITKLKEEIGAHKTQEIQGLKVKLSEKELANKNLTDQIAKLKEEIGVDEAQKIQDLRKEISEKEALNKNLTEQIAKLQEGIGTNATQQIQDLKKELSEKELANKNLIDQITTLKEDKSSKEKINQSTPQDFSKSPHKYSTSGGTSFSLSMPLKPPSFSAPPVPPPPPPPPQSNQEAKKPVEISTRSLEIAKEGIHKHPPIFNNSAKAALTNYLKNPEKKNAFINKKYPLIQEYLKQAVLGQNWQETSFNQIEQKLAKLPESFSTYFRSIHCFIYDIDENHPEGKTKNTDLIMNKANICQKAMKEQISSILKPPLGGEVSLADSMIQRLEQMSQSLRPKTDESDDDSDDDTWSDYKF